ncbi:MAG: hypothetical protein AB8B84_16005 [Granulosicoccus sp.]
MPVSKALVPDYTLDEDEPIVQHSVLEESAEVFESISESDLDIETALSTIDTSAVDIELASGETDQISQDLASELDDENWDETENYQQFEQTLNSIPPVFFASAAIDSESFFENLDSSEASSLVIKKSDVNAGDLQASSEVGEVGEKNSLSESEAPIQLDASVAIESENTHDDSEALSVFDTLSNPVIIDADENLGLSSEIESERMEDLANDLGSNHEDPQPTDETNQELRRAFSENISFAGHLVDSVSTDDFVGHSSEVVEKNSSTNTAVADESQLDCSLDLGEVIAEEESLSGNTAEAYIVEISDVSESVSTTENRDVVNSDEATSESAQTVSTNSELIPDEVETGMVSETAEIEKAIEISSDGEKSTPPSPLDITSQVLIREVPEGATDVDSDTVVSEPVKKKGFVKRWANRVVSWIKRFVGF